MEIPLKPFQSEYRYEHMIFLWTTYGTWVIEERKDKKIRVTQFRNIDGKPYQQIFSFNNHETLLNYIERNVY